MADKLTKELIPFKEKALKEAYREQVKAEADYTDAEANRDNTLEEIMEAARAAGRDDLVDSYNQYCQEVDQTKEALKTAKDQTELSKADFSMTVLMAAGGVKGRGTHANVNIVSDIEVTFPINDPVKMGRAVEWLLAQQVFEPKVLSMIQIKTSPISFFQNAAENGTLPRMFGDTAPLITVQERTITRVDSLDKWIDEVVD